VGGTPGSPRNRRFRGVGWVPPASGRSIGVTQDLISLLAEYEAAGTPCVLATVVACEAPTSARSGDKAVITAEGRLVGWVGGSCSEPIVRREALRALVEGTPRVVRIVPAAEAEGAADPGQAGELTMATTCPSGGSLEIFVEPRLPRPLLAVFGASPAAQTLVQLGARTGFRTCAVHPGAQAEDYPDADLVLPALDLARARPGTDTWAVVATMGHYDEDALEAALAHPAVDVALVASARRAAATLEVLRQRGLDEAALSRVRYPAGGVRAATQEEIALFALAEIVSRRREAPRAAPAPLEKAPTFHTDPVCGMPVDAEAAVHRVDLEDATFFFCGAGCRERFLREPDAYRPEAQRA
jgi:xanthine dehydrogenase accessory factor